MYKADVIAFVADVIAINFAISIVFMAGVIAKMSWCYVITNCFHLADVIAMWLMECHYI